MRWAVGSNWHVHCHIQSLSGTECLERIVKTSVQSQSSLIVMGTHGPTEIARVALASVAECLVRLAPCAVLTVEATTESDSWLKVFYDETFLGIKAES
jgi:nucleotide-binding universal stress UspA family protein